MSALLTVHDALGVLSLWQVVHAALLELAVALGHVEGAVGLPTQLQARQHTAARQQDFVQILRRMVLRRMGDVDSKPKVLLQLPPMQE